MPFVTTTSCSKKTEDVTQSIINEFKAITNDKGIITNKKKIFNRSRVYSFVLLLED